MIVEAKPIADLFGDGFFVVQVAQNTNKTWVSRYSVVSFRCEQILDSEIVFACQALHPVLLLLHGGKRRFHCGDVRTFSHIWLGANIRPPGPSRICPGPSQHLSARTAARSMLGT
jgi:hypothetical protein